MPTGYIHFTDEQKEIARQTDIADLLRRQGETLKRSGSELEWRDGFQKVTVRGNLWFHQYDQKGGDAIDFVRRFYNKTYPEAMEYLLGGCGGTLKTSPPVVKEKKPFELPPKNDNMHRAFAYLTKTRGVDKDVLQAFADRNMIYESADYHNAVFIGYDRNGIPAMRTSEVPVRQAPTEEMWIAVCPSTAFTGMAQAISSICLRRLSICSVLSPCIRKTGKPTAMRRLAVSQAGFCIR